MDMRRLTRSIEAEDRNHQVMMTNNHPVGLILEGTSTGFDSSSSAAVA